MVLSCQEPRTRFSHALFRDTMQDEVLVCALFPRQIRKVNGRWDRFKYEIREGGRHFLGGREVKAKRKDPGRIFGCRKCYEKLDSTPVSHNSSLTKICSFDSP